MAAETASTNSQLAARLGSDVRTAGTRLLTIDTTVRSYVLSGGGWRLYGNSTAFWYGVRVATDATGTLATGEVAPTTSELAAAAAGTPGSGAAWDAAQTVTGLRAPTDAAVWAELAVKRGGFLVLYVRAGSAITAVLEGPFSSPESFER